MKFLIGQSGMVEMGAWVLCIAVGAIIWVAVTVIRKKPPK